jgi:hypothetical protein
MEFIGCGSGLSLFDIGCGSGLSLFEGAAIGFKEL